MYVCSAQRLYYYHNVYFPLALANQHFNIQSRQSGRHFQPFTGISWREKNWEWNEGKDSTSELPCVDFVTTLCKPVDPFTGVIPASLRMYKPVALGTHSPPLVITHARSLPFAKTRGGEEAGEPRISTGLPGNGMSIMRESSAGRTKTVRILL